jgi:hypothetical protein
MNHSAGQLFWVIRDLLRAPARYAARPPAFCGHPARTEMPVVAGYELRAPLRGEFGTTNIPKFAPLWVSFELYGRIVLRQIGVPIRGLRGVERHLTRSIRWSVHDARRRLTGSLITTDDVGSFSL